MKKILLGIVIALLMLLTITLVLFLKYTDNKTIGIAHYNINSEKIPGGFDGYRIVQVADLHNTEFGENNQQLLSLIAECEPNIIVFTGDQIDARKTDIDVILEFAKQAVQIAPCYLVTGNHEGSTAGNQFLNATLSSIGITVLDNKIATLEANCDTLCLVGVDDPTIDNRFMTIGQEMMMEETLTQLCTKKNGYSILLSHHPEYLELYAKYDFDLVLSGHAHGGQIRIKDQGIIAPNQGLFPTYDAGQYTLNNTTMILSRGLGNSLFPWRINNPPELVVVELSSK